MDITQPERGVAVVAGPDRGYPVFVTKDFHRPGDAREGNLAVQVGQRGAQPEEAGDEPDDDHADGDADEPAEQAEDEAHQAISRMMVFLWVKCSSIASSEASFPKPDCLTPP